MKNMPIYLAYYILPCISFVYGISIGGKCLNYELIWLTLLPTSLLLIGKQTMSQKAFGIAGIIFVSMTCKYFLPLLWVDSITWRALFIDAKWICYFLLALLWINSSGGLDVMKFYKAGRNFCYLYILIILIIINIVIIGFYFKRIIYFNN